MAYRNPNFYFHHAMRTALVANLGGSAYAAASPLARVIDSSISQLGQYNAAAVNQFTKVNRGAGFASLPSPDRLIIPAGHTLAGTTVEVRHNASDPGTGTTGTAIFSGAVAAGLQVLTLSPVLSLQYALVNVPASGAWAFPELWLAVKRTTVRGVVSAWKQTPLANVQRSDLEGGQSYALRLGAKRRQYDLTWQGLSATDKLVFDDLLTETQDGALPFYFDPPDDAEGTVLVHAITPTSPLEEVTQDMPAPQVGPTYTISLKLRELLT
jgi:hypothetical protein